MRPWFFQYLLCPSCGRELDMPSVVGRNGELTLQGDLVCLACRRAYPIVRGIPRFLLEKNYAIHGRTQKSFSYSWRRFSEIYANTHDFLDWLAPLEPADFRDKVVLDAGCGSGQHAAHVVAFGARAVVAFDISQSVDVALAHARGLENVLIVQADINHPPLRPVFELVYSIGVLHHLPDAAEGFAALARLVRPGGRLSVWVYGYEGTWIVRHIIDPVRRITSRLPVQFVFGLSIVLAMIFALLAKAIAQPLAASQCGRKVLSVIPLGTYLNYMARFPIPYLLNSVFDQLIAPITRYFRREDVDRWYRTAGLKEIAVTARNDMSWRGTGVRR